MVFAAEGTNAAEQQAHAFKVGRQGGITRNAASKRTRGADICELASDHLARFIQRGTEAEHELKPEDAPHIERISIKETNEEV